MNIFTELQTILQMLLDTAVIGGGLAVGVLAGYAIFKLLTLASYLYLAKIIVERIYELVKKRLEKPEPPIVNKVDIGGRFITHDCTPELFMELISAIKNIEVSGSQYVHSRDIEKAIKIINKSKMKD